MLRRWGCEKTQRYSWKPESFAYLWTQWRLWRTHWDYECIGPAVCACAEWEAWRCWCRLWVPNATSGNNSSTMCSDRVTMIHRTEQILLQCDVSFDPFSSSVWGRNVFISIGRVQHPKIQKPVYLVAFILSLANMKHLELIVMAWKPFNSKVLPMHTTLTTLWI